MYIQYPYNIFNQLYLSADYLKQHKLQRHIEQQTNVADMVKTISDFCTATREIDPEYQQEAVQACIAEIVWQLEMEKKKTSGEIKIGRGNNMATKNPIADTIIVT